jgi:hypothetical protein
LDVKVTFSPSIVFSAEIRQDKLWRWVTQQKTCSKQFCSV